MRQGLGPVLGDHDALAGRQPVVLDDVRRTERVQRVGHLSGGRADVGQRGGHLGRGHHLLGVGLAALELRRLAAGAEAGDPAGADDVGDAGHQRGLGADDDQVGAHLDGQVGDALAVQQARRQVAAEGDGVDAGVAGGGDDGVHGRVGGQGGHDGVLAGTGSENENLHGRQQ